MYQIREYITEQGRNPFQRWLKKLTLDQGTKVQSALRHLRRGWIRGTKHIGNGVFELRMHTGPGYRIYFGMDGAELVILLIGGDKSSQQRDTVEHRGFGERTLPATETLPTESKAARWSEPTKEQQSMPTRDYRETLLERAQDESEFREELLKGAVRCMFNGEPRIGRLRLHNYIYAAIGFDELSRKTGRRLEDLERIFSRNGNPRADELLSIIAALAEHEDIELDVQATQRDRSEQLVAD